MICNGLMWSTLMVVVLVLGSNSIPVMARSAEGLARIEKLLSSSSSSSSPLASPSEPSPLTAALAQRGHSLPKRAVLDQSCKGIFDRELFKKLDRVCEDCYNLYRKPYVGIDCRRNCFLTKTFDQCVVDLLLDEKEFGQIRDYVAFI